jgi:hypothetical protein
MAGFLTGLQYGRCASMCALMQGVLKLWLWFHWMHHTAHARIRLCDRSTIMLFLAASNNEVNAANSKSRGALKAHKFTLMRGVLKLWLWFHWMHHTAHARTRLCDLSSIMLNLNDIVLNRI